MITKMTGTLTRVLDDEARLQVGPFEYQVLVPEFVRRQVQTRTGAEVTFHTLEYIEGEANASKMIPRRIGFLSETELDFFELFCTVDKIGSKKALKAMGRPIKEMADAIQRQDAKWLTTMPGIGKQTAEQIIATLKNKVTKFAMAARPASRATATGPGSIDRRQRVRGRLRGPVDPRPEPGGRPQPARPGGRQRQAVQDRRGRAERDLPEGMTHHDGGRPMNRVAGLLAVAIAVVVGSFARADATADDWKKLAGTWKVEGATLNGADATAALKSAVLTIEEGKYKLFLGNTDTGTLAIDPAKKPKAMTITGTDGPNKGKTIPAIYEIDGDTVKICYTLGGEQGRPDGVQIDRREQDPPRRPTSGTRNDRRLPTSTGGGRPTR